MPNLKYTFAKSKDLIPPYGIIQHYQYLSLLYHKDVEEPASWIDYWQPAKKYGEKVTQEVTGPGGGPVQLQRIERVIVKSPNQDG